MTERLKTPFLSRATKETVTPFEKSKWDNLVIGFDSGLKETSLSYFNTVNIERKAKNQWENLGESEITEELYNDPNFSLNVPGLEWEPHLTYEMLYEALDAQHASQRFQNAQGGFFSMKTLGAFGGAMIDPVNLIPAPIGLAGKSILKTAALIGSLNAGLELAIAPVGYKAYAARGMEGEYSVARNMAFAAILGGLMGSIGPSLGKILGHMRAMNFPENAGNVAMRTLNKTFNKIDKRIRGRIDDGSISMPIRITGARTIDFNIAGTHFIDSRGIVQTTAPIGPHVKLQINELGNVKISGDMPTIVRSADDIMDNIKGVISFGDIKNNKQIITSKSSLDESSFGNVIDFEGGERSFDKIHKLDDRKNSGLEVLWDDDFETPKSIIRYKLNKKTGKYEVEEVITDSKKFDTLIDEIARTSPESEIGLKIKAKREPQKSMDEIEATERQQRTDDSTKFDEESQRILEEDADLPHLLALMKFKKKLPLSNKEADILFYNSYFKNNMSPNQQKRLGYTWDESTQTLKRTRIADDLNEAEKITLEGADRIEKKYKATVKEENGKTKLFDCATKKGL